MLLDKLINILAPHACLSCDREGQLLCDDCLKAVPKRRSTCYQCNKLTTDHKVCLSCRRRTALRRVVVAAHYEHEIKELINRLKYQQAVAAAEVCARLLSRQLKDADFDFVTFVPSVSSRQRQRGYNQARLIARALAHDLRVPLVATLGRLGKARQVGSTRKQRLNQVKDTIYAIRPVQAKGPKCLIVDDVLTTGATLSECARVLKEAGAKEIAGAVVAKN